MGIVSNTSQITKTTEPVYFIDKRIFEKNSEVFNQKANEMGQNPLTMCKDCKKDVKASIDESTTIKEVDTASKDTQSVSYGSVDKRVALTCAPKVHARDESQFASKVFRVLGQEKFRKDWIKTGYYFYGLLHNALSSSSGLIFPYTPKVSFQHKVNWATESITHSNLVYNAYQSTPPPGITLSAKFTADNRDNALHMLSAIWFLTACTKCEFGEKSSEPGLPPPVLYLNGYDHLIDNIPVVIQSVSYDYPEDKHYVNLVLDMSKNYNNGEPFCKIYDLTTTTTETVTSTTYPPGYRRSESPGFGGPPEVIEIYDLTKGGPEDVKKDSKTTESVQVHGIDLSFWLPTSLSINIGLLVQPNFIKTKKQWKLADYKSGLLTHWKGKNPPAKGMSTSTTTISNPQALESGQEGFACITTTTVSENLNFIPSGWTW